MNREAYEKWACTLTKVPTAWEAWQAALQSGEPVARVIDDGTPEGATEWIPFRNRTAPLKTGDLLYTHPQPAVQHDGQGEAARETLASWMLSRGFSTGHGDKVDDLLAELGGQITQPAVPEALGADLNDLYGSAYHAGHHDTVECCYRDVYAVDRFDYWEDRVSECIDGGDMPAVKALLSADKEVSDE
jgi:hypothetical protein